MTAALSPKTWQEILTLSGGTTNGKLEATREILTKWRDFSHEEVLVQLKRMIATGEPETVKIELARGARKWQHKSWHVQRPINIIIGPIRASSRTSEA